MRGSRLGGFGFGIPEFQGPVPGTRDERICAVVSTSVNWFYSTWANILISVV